MGISGNIKTMALAELLQWLMMGQKTGTLKFEGKKVTKRVFFEKGIIISSSSTDPNEYLGRFLVNHGYISEDKVNAAVARQKEENQLIGRILVTMGAISEEDLHQILRIKAEESIYDIFTWEEGAFEFFDNELPAETMIRMQLDVQWIVLEGSRRTDEWQRIKETVPSEQCVPVLVVDPNQYELEDLQRRILEWVDDDRSVEEISQGAQIGLFQVSELLATSVQSGLIKVVRPRIIEIEIQVPVERPAETPSKSEKSHDSGVFFMPPHFMGQQGMPNAAAMQMYAQAMQTMQGMGMPNMPNMQGMPGMQMPIQGMPGMQMPGGYQMPGMPGQPGQMPANAPAMVAPAPSAPVDLGGGRSLTFANSGGQVSAPAAPAVPVSEAERLIQEADAALGRSELDIAFMTYKKAKSAAGSGPAIDDKVKAGETKIDQEIERSGITIKSVPKLKCDMTALTKLTISPQEGYMLTRVDGTYDLGSILKIVPLAKLDAKLLFWKLRKSGHVTI
jgi:Domain of unknown function (DUF4388)